MSLFNYKKFLNNENKEEDIKLIYSDSFIKILNDINTDISKIILDKNNIEYDMTYVSITDNKNTISFLQSNNVDKVLSNDYDPWNISSRQEMKIGRFITKLLKIDNTPRTEIDEFVVDYKTIYEYSTLEGFFEIVENDEISHFYNCQNQIGGGQLGKSCMGGRDQQPYIKDFYDNNSDSIKMLILKDKSNDNKIIGRANLWFLEKPKDRIFMDRIYTNDDYLIKVFIKYAEKNNYIYKSRQIYGGNVIPVINNGKEEKLIMTTHFKIMDYNHYPYVDTLQFYNKKTGEITNNTKMWDKTNNDDWIGLLHAGGRYLTKDNSDGFKMDYLGRLVHPYFVVWSKIDKCYIHKDYAIYLDYKNDYCVPERKFVKINNNIYLKEDTYFDDDKKEYIKK